jgi:hypothetical protein
MMMTTYHLGLLCLQQTVWRWSRLTRPRSKWRFVTARHLDLLLAYTCMNTIRNNKTR